MDCLKFCVAEEFSRLCRETFEMRRTLNAFMNCGDSEGDIWGDESHGLIDDVATLSENGNRLKHYVLAAEEMCDGFIIEGQFQSCSPISDESRQRVSKRGRTGN